VFLSVSSELGFFGLAIFYLAFGAVPHAGRTGATQVIKVTHVLPNFGPAGAEHMAASLMRTLDRQRFEVSAISLFDRSGTRLEELLERDGIPVRYLGKRPGFDPRMFVLIARTLERIRPHVVHTHRYVLRYCVPYLLSRQVPVKVHTVHNIAEKEVGLAGRLVHRVAFKGGVLPVAIAEEVDNSLRRYYGISDSPLIPNGIPVERFRHPSVGREAWLEREGFAPTDFLFVCVAWLRPQKNPSLLLESFARGPASDPRARLLFVGGGELRADLEGQIYALGLQDKVHLLGVRSDIPEVLNAADVFVLSSDYEGNPLSVMEAMAAGKPVICTAVGGVPELVEDGGGGLLVPPGDAKALACAMRRMLEDPRARASMGGASAKRAVERFDLQAMTEAYEDLYRTAVAKAHPLP
jgi:glycosyltransferase involved in cell wall biosynthesis